MFHDNQRVDTRDRFFIVGKNPKEDGGGVIASTNSGYMARGIRQRAIELGYKNVMLLNWRHFSEMGE